MAFVGRFQDGCHGSFPIHHGVESETQIVELFYLLQKCGNTCGVFPRKMANVLEMFATNPIR